MNKAAIISTCGTYRYLLQRSWDARLQAVCFVMLNPSTADAELDDPTIRRCLGFARDWGYGQLEVVNLFALRATDPQQLRTHHDPVGPENFEQLIQSARVCQRVICAWGNHGDYLEQAEKVLSLLRENGIRPYALRISKIGQPCHPLYLPKHLQPVEL